MREYHFPVALVLLMLSASLAHAGGLIYELPKDGTWATYQADTSVSVGDVELERVKSIVRIASVGEGMENSAACRWIEIVMKAKKESKEPQPEGKTRVRVYDEKVYKLLFPEGPLSKGEASLDHVIRGWMRRGKGKPQKISISANNQRALASILPGQLEDARPLPKIVVESKLGKLSCAGVAGSIEIEGPMGGMQPMNLEDRLHPDAPFGLVGSRGSFEAKLQRSVGDVKEGTVKVQWNFKLTDYGDGAASEMPDAD